ncbi:MAG: hypothetical protein QXS93_00085 [Candidatus Micrarchaeia archaeon]
MHNDELEQQSKQALSKGYIVTPFALSNESDKMLRAAALSHIMKAVSMNEFMQREIIDRLTYTRDYGISKSINFMVVSKNDIGQPVGVAHFVYSKSSGIMYLQDFAISEKKDVHKNEVLALLAVGAREHMIEYGMRPKAILVSPSLKKDGIEGLNLMRELKMKFMALEPKTEKNFAAVEKQHKNKVPFFEIVKGDKITDMRVILVHNYSGEKFKLNEEIFSKFLKDLKDQDELALLLGAVHDSKFKITLTNMDESNKLIDLLKKISWNTDKKNP